MLQLINFHDNANEQNLKLAPGKAIFKLLAVKYVGNEISFCTIKPFHSKITTINRIPSPTAKI